LSLPANDGTDKVYRIRVGLRGQPFPDTPSVVADKATIESYNAVTKARRDKRKRKADEITIEADGSEGVEAVKSDQ
jgi:hypothetical protein